MSDKALDRLNMLGLVGVCTSVLGSMFVYERLLWGFVPALALMFMSSVVLRFRAVDRTQVCPMCEGSGRVAK